MTTTVLVVDDHDLLRAGIVAVLETDPGIRVVGEAADGPSAVRRARQLRPDVVLMDVEMPGGDGIEATAALTGGSDGPRVLILTMFDLDEYVVDGLRAGASGFLLKTAPPEALHRAVLACAAGQTTVTSEVMQRVLDRVLPRQEEVPGLARLTPRESDVLRALARGLSNAEIGAELFLAETTVKTHVARVLAKLGARDRLQAVVLARRGGLDGV